MSGGGWGVRTNTMLRTVGWVLALWAMLALQGASFSAGYPTPRGAGVVVVNEVTAEQLDLLGPVWYYRYGYEGEELRGHARVLLVRPHFDSVAVRQALRQHPGAWWLVGNEPNDPFQDNLSPAAYAAFYHRFARLAWGVDRSCHLVPAGIANADWRWAQAFRDSYVQQYGEPPRVAAWNIHNYILEPDRDQLELSEFQARVIAFRQWMAQVGEADKPLLLTEFGVLFGAGLGGRPAEDPARIEAFVRGAVAWLASTEYVQGWAWFANHTGGQFNGDLYLDNGELSVFGELYREALLAIPRWRTAEP